MGLISYCIYGAFIKAICNHERTVVQEGQEEDADGGWGMQRSSVA
jgi:hypothetical protein